MQAYNASFARIYNLRWTSFAQNAALKIRMFYEATPLGQQNHRLLDLCCGTGQLALHFLDSGYEVTGIDLSDAMLDYARGNAAAYIVAGQAHFLQGDAAHFELDETFGLVVSTFDALNHLPDFEALKGCFRSVAQVLLDGGLFVFDLNTPQGLRNWTGVSVEDTPDLMLVTRSLYDETTRRAYIRISGFVPADQNLYERFEETTYEIPFDLAEVRTALFAAGFRTVHFARLQNLSAPVQFPEQENRIFVLAGK
jgi:SAM-dependent methyltransferase